MGTPPNPATLDATPLAGTEVRLVPPVVAPKLETPPLSQAIPRHWPTDAINLGLLLLLGVAASAWLLYFTDLFPAVATLMTLGGAFTFLGVVLKIVPDDRAKELQRWIYGNVIQSRVTTLGLTFMLVIGAIFAFFLGGIQIELLHDTTDRVAWVYPRGAGMSAASEFDRDSAERLSPGERLRHLARRFAKHEVKVSGYPSISVTPGWRREDIRFPYAARRVFLLRPSPTLTSALLPCNDAQFIVYPQDHPESTKSLRHYKGQAVWIGCDADVTIPGGELDKWRGDEDLRKWTPHWLPALAADAFHELGVGDHLVVEVKIGDTLKASQVIQHDREANTQGFVTVVVLQ